MSLTEKNSFWARIVEGIERDAHNESKKDILKNYDYAVTLPDKLRKRVAKILPYEYDEYDKTVFIAESEVETPVSFGEDEDEDEPSEKKKKEKKVVAFNESTCSEIERLEHEHPKFVLNVQKQLGFKTKAKRKDNWCSTYICQPRKERIKWDSKIYDMERNLADISLDEQAEQLMDASAERFTEWLNSLGRNRESDMSKEQLISLFSIEGDRKLLSSIITEPKEVKAIAKTVADKWNLPDMAIELKYENYINKILKNVPKKVDSVAFGRTIPVKDRPWIPDSDCGPIRTVFPKEILTFEKLFKGITHLRSTKALTEFYAARPDLEKPEYLLRSGLFRPRTESHTVTEIPLYERLKLKY